MAPSNMRTIALLGHPVAHSISPRFQQAALDAMGVDARYEAWDVLPADLPIAVERLRSAELLGANVTVPHKVEIRRLVDRPDALVERVGAVNTIVRRDGQLHATNTDVAGILRALEGAEVGLAGQRVVLIGAGGAARAVVVAMRTAGASMLTVANRSRERAAALVPLGGDELDLEVCALDEGDDRFREALSEAAVVIHSTTLGMRHGPDEGATPVPASLFRPGQVAFDLVYVPERTPFLAAAERAGARTVGGLAMLVHQGAEAFRLWTGYEPPIDVMFAAARAALAS
ncbi:MAG: shikimate dehydrogenase [Dehalococcoidia bacterium]